MSASNKSWPWGWVPTTVFFIGISSIVLLLWVNRISERTHLHALIVDAIMDVQIKTSTGHLWLEEAVSGDDTAGEALADIDRAIRLLDAVLNGGASEHGPIPQPLEDPELRRRGEELRALLANFRMLAGERLRNIEKAGIASNLDQQFDAAFKNVLGQAGILEEIIKKYDAGERTKSYRLFLGILCAWAFIVVATTAGLWSREGRRIRAEEALQQANGQLLAQTEELTEHRERLAELVEMRTAELTHANELLRIESAERRLRQRAIEASSNGVLITDLTLPDNPIVYANPAFEQITGYTAAEALGHNARLLMRDDGEQMGLEEIRAALREERDGHAILRNYRKDGSLFWNALSISPVRDDDGKMTHYVGIINDITEQKRYEEQLEYRASHDELTDLPNRNLLADLIVQFVPHAHRHRKEMAVLFIDLDHFKFVNDSLGHGVGDRVLKLMAERLRASVRAADTVARYGGDEFVVVLTDLAKSEDAVPVAQTIREALARPIEIDGQEIVLSCSTGISIYPKDGSDAPTLLKNADAAMFRAKEQGRNNFQFYTRELNERVVAHMIMEKHLRRALENGELDVHYQPQVDLATGRLNGMEALLRWRNPELGMVSPGTFIPLAEETGLIVPFFEWALETACTQNLAWQTAGLPALTVAVNLSPAQFKDRNLCASIARIVNRTGMAPARLELEIVESMVMQDVESAMLILKELKAFGVQLAMDDFGTGYSSLSYLKRFPFDKLKIDISFVREVTTDPESAAIARSIIAMGHNLNLRVIAEGIETAGQLAYLRAHGCDEMQGFFFSRPLPAAEFEALLRADRCLALPAQNDAYSTRTLLIVDDEPSVIAALAGMLDNDGYRILTATNAEEGLELLAVNRVGVVACDQRMPGMCGIDLLHRVKAIHPETVRILLSGYADQEMIIDAVNRGAVYKFLAKPMDQERLREEIRDAFRYYDQTQECEWKSPVAS